jgi:hypothetical protein
MFVHEYAILGKLSRNLPAANENLRLSRKTSCASKEFSTLRRTVRPATAKPTMPRFSLGFRVG